MTLRVDGIRECLDGVIPGLIATCAPDGTPNVTFLSQVEYLDSEHVAASYQFFNKTRQNILANPYARLMLTHPLTAVKYRLRVQYLRTETEGPLFERMKAKLAGIASHTGMSGVFRLLGSDIFRVLEIEQVQGKSLLPPLSPNRLARLRSSAERIRQCTDLEGLFHETLACLEKHFDVRNAMLLMLDGRAGRLYTVASHGYEQSGVGSEIAVGEGVIGVAARERTPIRIGHMTAEYGYGQAIRKHIEQQGMGVILENEIPLPGLLESRSQLAVPIVACGRLLGVLFVESSQDLRFNYDDEDALVTLAAQVGIAIYALQHMAEAAEESSPRPRQPAPAKVGGAPLLVRHYQEDDTIFLGDEYLIKGVAGGILWTLLGDYTGKKRCTFTNRELRLDPRLQLPDVGDNLEARLVLLRRRLEERDRGLLIEKVERGRFRLIVNRQLELVQIRSGLPR
jgi:GAF domain-containing protein/pyridoxamine 5'-phosphate oxidase-like protein